MERELPIEAAHLKRPHHLRIGGDDQQSVVADAAARFDKNSEARWSR
jgi:hypothetical protein